MTVIRDRIVELRRVRAAELRRHPQNWRVHPDRQRAAMQSVLDEVGYADALIARVLPDGALELIDGHLRADTTPEAEVPVLIVDLNEREAALLLAVHDPIAAMAETDDEMLAGLLRTCDVQRAEVDRLLHDVLGKVETVATPVGESPEPALCDLFQVVVECCDEAHQRQIFDRMTAEGLKCRVLTL